MSHLFIITREKNKSVRLQERDQWLVKENKLRRYRAFVMMLSTYQTLLVPQAYRRMRGKKIVNNTCVSAIFLVLHARIVYFPMACAIHAFDVYEVRSKSDVYRVLAKAFRIIFSF